MKQRLNYVTIAVQDFNKSLTFYKDGLGWKPFQIVEGTIAFFGVGGLIFSICSRKELSDDVQVELTTKPYLGVTFSQNVPSKEAVDEVFATIRQANGTIVKEPHATSWGGYNGYFSDPEGHLWEIAYNPQSTFDSQGDMTVPS